MGGSTVLQVVGTTSKVEQQKIALDIIIQVGGRQALLNLLHCVTSCCTAGERQSARHIIGI